MNKMIHYAKLVISAVIAALFAAPVSAATCTSIANGNWNAKSTWGTVLLGCVGATGGIPGAADGVIISNNNTVTVNAAGLAAKSVTIATGNRLSSLTFNAGTSLTVTTNVTINPPTSGTAGRNKQILVNGGSLTVNGSVTMSGAAGAVTTLTTLDVTTGTIMIAGGLTNTIGGGTGRAQVTISNNGAININGAGGITNGDTVTVGTGTLNVAGGTFTNNNVVTVSTGLINVTGAYINTMDDDTVTITGAGERLTVGGTLTNNGAITLTATGIVNANGAFTNSTTGVFTNTAAGLLNIGGNATVDGTFSGGAGKVVCNGGAAQNLSGSALTSPAVGLNNFEISNANGVTLGGNVTVNGVLTFTNGNISTGTNTLITSANCPGSVVRTSGYVIGNLRLAFPAGATTCTYAVGDSIGYAPATVALTGATAGTMTGRVDNGDHPDTIANISRIDQTKSANHYWTLTPGTLATYTSYAATLQFNAGLDATANTNNFIVAKKNAGAWIRPTVGTRTATSTQAIGITLAQGFGVFAVGEPLVGVYKGVNQLIDLREVY